jgi:uncharacterized damage-inducible protein DinB
MPQSKSDKEVIKYLIKFLEGGHAHATLETILKDIPAKIRGEKPHGLPYSIWQQVEHIRITQWDILDFSRNPDYKEIKWPDDYWPKVAAPKNDAEWNKSINQIFSDTKEFIDLLKKSDVDLYTPFTWGEGQNLLREAMLIANHNSHHAGEIIVMRRLLGAWK